MISLPAEMFCPNLSTTRFQIRANTPVKPENGTVLEPAKTGAELLDLLEMLETWVIRLYDTTRHIIDDLTTAMLSVTSEVEKMREDRQHLSATKAKELKRWATGDVETREAMLSDMIAELFK